MKVLVTGANGFVGHYLVAQLLQKSFTVIATGKGNCRLPFTSNKNFIYISMDFTDPYSVYDVFENYKPDVVVHAGAMSKPDACELNQWEAYVTNTEATLHLLVNAEDNRSFFIFLSTDFVFSGEEGMYKENDERNPVNFYGKTKLDAEDAVKEYPYNWSIVRTVLVYGQPQSGGSNLLTVIKEKLENGEGYNAFDDQVRTPTYVEDLANTIVTIIEKKATGIFHISGAEVMTPYEMACRIADHLHLDKNLIKKITAADMQQPAKRPLKTGFNISKATKQLGFVPVSFEQGLKKTFL